MLQCDDTRYLLRGKARSKRTRAEVKALVKEYCADYLAIALEADGILDFWQRMTEILVLDVNLERKYRSQALLDP